MNYKYYNAEKTKTQFEVCNGAMSEERDSDEIRYIIAVAQHTLALSFPVPVFVGDELSACSSLSDYFSHYTK